MRILAIDPGPEASGYVVWDHAAGRVLAAGDEIANARLRTDHLGSALAVRCDALAIERVCCYGKPVGDPVFETVFFSGRLAEWWQQLTGLTAIRLRFGDVALHHCHDRRAKESYVRQVLLDRFGGKGTFKKPGPFHGVAKHAWSAAALAIAVADQLERQKEA